MTYNLVDVGYCPKHLFVVYFHGLYVYFHYSVDLKFKGGIPVRKISFSVNLYMHRKRFFLALFHLGEVYFFAFLLSSIHLFDIAMGTVPPLSHIATGCQAVITVTSSLPTTPCGPVRCRGCWTTKYRHTNTLGQ